MHNEPPEFRGQPAGRAANPPFSRILVWNTIQQCSLHAAMSADGVVGLDCSPTGNDVVSSDIDPILNDWPYRPDEITVRVIEGDDGQRKIQLRLDLGVLQMEFDGRPDGRRIHDCSSWFEYHQKRQRDHDTANPDGAPYLLEPEDCAELLREGVQYYHRYICFWHLGHYELCARDTERNLRLFAFVREHAHDDRDKLRFDQWRPYVTMMHARAVATPLVELEQWDAAAGVLDAGIRGIEQFLEEYNQVDQASQVGELDVPAAVEGGNPDKDQRRRARNRRRNDGRGDCGGPHCRTAGTDRVGNSRRAVRRCGDAAR